MQIEDGKGTGNRAEVNEEKQLVVSAITETSLEHESEENGSGYVWSSSNVTVDATDTVLLLKNTSDTPLHIECVKVSGTVATTQVTVHLPTTEVTVTAGGGGAVVTGTNLNTSSSNVADASAASDETNNSQGNIIAEVFLSGDSTENIETPGLILGKNKSIGVDTSNTLEIAAAIVGHFED